MFAPVKALTPVRAALVTRAAIAKAIVSSIKVKPFVRCAKWEVLYLPVGDVIVSVRDSAGPFD